MCMNVKNVKVLIQTIEIAKNNNDEEMFDKNIKKLGKELSGVIVGEIDYDALIHSFL